MQTVLYLEHEGRRYRRYPDSPTRSHRVYWQRGGGGTKGKSPGFGYLHRDVWEAANGPIPPGYHIHHKDHDPLNNDLANLELIAPTQHIKHHLAHLTDEQKARREEHLAAIRPLVKIAQNTPEFRAKRAELSRQQFARLERVGGECVHCGAAFLSWDGSAIKRRKFCSNNCRSAARRAANADVVEKACLGCGAIRKGNKYLLKDWCRDCGRWHPGGPAMQNKLGESCKESLA